MKRSTARANAPVRMSCPNHSSTPSSIASCSCRSNYNAPDRPKLEHCIFRSSRRGRPNSLSTSFLILRPSRSIYSNPSGIRSDFTYCHSLLKQKRIIRYSRNNLCYTRNRSLRIHCMSPPHIYCGNGCRHSSVFHSRHNNYRCSHWNQSL